MSPPSNRPPDVNADQEVLAQMIAEHLAWEAPDTEHVRLRFHSLVDEIIDAAEPVDTLRAIAARLPVEREQFRRDMDASLERLANI